MADYIITNGSLVNVDSLKHHGVIGMKWGIRRYQNKDGTLTNAGKKRYDKEMEKLKAEEKVVKNRERVKARMDKLDAKKADLESRKKALDDSEKNATNTIKKVLKKDSENSGESQTSQHKTKATKLVPLKALSDEQLAAKVERLQLENRYRELMNKTNPPKADKGKSFVSKVVSKTAEDLGPQVAKHYVAKLINQAIGDKDEAGNIIDRVFANNKKKS